MYDDQNNDIMSDKAESINNNRIELLAAFLMSLVVISTAWSAFQATLWGGIQTFALREVAAAAQKATMLTLQQGQYSTVDVIMFLNYVDALHNNNHELSKFYFDRFRADFKPAVEAWLETKPFENPNAPASPFVMAEYNKTFSAESERFAAESALKLQEAEQANRNSDNYMLMTVVYAAILFIGGIFSRFSGVRRLSLVVVGCGLFSIATFFLLSMPVAPLFKSA